MKLELGIKSIKALEWLPTLNFRAEKILYAALSDGFWYFLSQESVFIPGSGV